MVDTADTPSSRFVRWTAVVALAGLLVVAATTPAVAASHDDDRAVVVDLTADGSATVTVTFAYDLETDAEQAAFEEIQANDTLQQEYKTRFQNRMRAVAADAGNRTGREMTVSNPAIAFETRDGGATGVVSLSVEWAGLAATTDAGLVVTEPFESGFESDRRFVLRGPEGYQLTEATPTPDTQAGNSAEWAAGTSLTGFEATLAESTPTASPTPAGGQGAPGFGIVAAVLAVLAAALLARR